MSRCDTIDQAEEETKKRTKNINGKFLHLSRVQKQNQSFTCSILYFERGKKTKMNSSLFVGKNFFFLLLSYKFVYPLWLTKCNCQRREIELSYKVWCKLTNEGNEWELNCLLSSVNCFDCHCESSFYSSVGRRRRKNSTVSLVNSVCTESYNCELKLSLCSEQINGIKSNSISFYPLTLSLTHTHTGTHTDTHTHTLLDIVK